MGSAAQTASEPAGTAPQSPLPGARSALVLLLLINMFNYIDRQVLAAVEPEIADELLNPARSAGARFWLSLRPEAEFWTGLLGTAFLVTYMLTAPLFGYLADRMSRWFLIGIGITVWTLASGGSGLAPTFGLMFLTRCFVGIGEAVYGPAAPSILSDLYPVKERGKVLAWFYAAIPVGSALGYVLGGQVAASALGWRSAFYLVVPPGILLTVLCLLMRDPPRGQADAAGGPRKMRLADYRVLARTPSYILCTAGMTAMTFALGGIAFWMKKYLIYRGVGAVAGIQPVVFFGGLSALAGLIGTLAGGVAGDRLRSRLPGSYFLVSGIAMLLAFPFILLFLYVSFPWAWVPLVLAVFCLFFNTGPTNTILANVTHPSIRSSAFALNILLIHTLGDAVSPPLIGLLSNWYSWEAAFIVVSLLVLAGGLLWLGGARYLAADTARAPTLIG